MKYVEISAKIALLDNTVHVQDIWMGVQSVENYINIHFTIVSAISSFNTYLFMHLIIIACCAGTQLRKHMYTTI